MSHMSIKALHIAQFRNLTHVVLHPTDQFNIVYGENGSGKSSLLEAIHYLSTGRSFRAANTKHLIQNHTKKFTLHAQIQKQQQQLIEIGVERDLQRNLRLRAENRDLSNFAELAAHLPLKIIHTQLHYFLEAGPLFRRKYLDWGLFYHFDEFLFCWRQYERVLKQRNSLLKSKCSRKDLHPWNEELIIYGSAFNQFRQDYLKELACFLQSVLQILFPLDEIHFCYDAGWDEQCAYSELLEKAYFDEIRLGYSLYGPHRADLLIKVNGLAAKHILSRGQQKLLICAMIIAQGKLLYQHKNKQLVYLIDDLPSELDEFSKQKLLRLLAEQQTQVFLSAIEPEAILDLVHDSWTYKMFHVKHGHILV